MLDKRSSGILLPVSALPSKEGIGTFGKEAYEFIDFLHSSNIKIWQVLPLNLTGFGDSPYQSCSAKAISCYYIDLNILQQKNLLRESEIKECDLFDKDNQVNYSKQFQNKIPLLKKAFSRFNKEDKGFKNFVQQGKFSDFALFMALKQKFDFKSWNEWDEPYKTYNENFYNFYIKENFDEFLFWQFTQYESLNEWFDLKKYANEKGVKIMGDIPLYLSYDSVEMWKLGEKIFMVDEYKLPALVAGAPPDAFSDSGQLWGNPLYDWQKMKKNGYEWWNERLNNSFELFDILRIDHFRGFDRFYAVPSTASDARQGEWLDGPKDELFADKLNLPIIAEDLGVLDDGVYRLMEKLGYPGMKILQFAFDGNGQNEHKPSNFTKNFVCYTGAHDNAPLKGHIESLSLEELKTYQADVISECGKLGVKCDVSSPENIAKTVIRLAFFSVANTVIIPLWDALLKGDEARINLPSSVSSKNWSWRVKKSELTKDICNTFKNLVQLSHR